MWSTSGYMSLYTHNHLFIATFSSLHFLYKFRILSTVRWFHILQNICLQSNENSQRLALICTNVKICVPCERWINRRAAIWHWIGNPNNERNRCQWKKLNMILSCKDFLLLYRLNNFSNANFINSIGRCRFYN